MTEFVAGNDHPKSPSDHQSVALQEDYLQATDGRGDVIPRHIDGAQKVVDREFGAVDMPDNKGQKPGGGDKDQNKGDDQKGKVAPVGGKAEKEEGMEEGKSSGANKPEADTPEIKEEILPNGNHKFTRQDGTYLVKTAGEKGQVVETHDAHGVTRKYTDKGKGEIEIHEGDKEKGIIYPNAKIDDQGTFTWNDGKTSHTSKVDGYSEVKNLQDGSAKINYPDGSWVEQKKDAEGLHTTTFADSKDNIKVCELTQFDKPKSLKVMGIDGEEEFKNVTSGTLTKIQAK